MSSPACAGCGSTKHIRSTHRDCPANFVAFKTPPSSAFIDKNTLAHAVLWEYAQGAKCTQYTDRRTVHIRDCHGIALSTITREIARRFGPSDQRHRVAQIEAVESIGVLPHLAIERIIAFAWGGTPECQILLQKGRPGGPSSLVHTQAVRWTSPALLFRPGRAGSGAHRERPFKVQLPLLPNHACMITQIMKFELGLNAGAGMMEIEPALPTLHRVFAEREQAVRTVLCLPKRLSASDDGAVLIFKLPPHHAASELWTPARQTAAHLIREINKLQAEVGSPDVASVGCRLPGVKPIRFQGRRPLSLCVPSMQRSMHPSVTPAGAALPGGQPVLFVAGNITFDLPLIGTTHTAGARLGPHAKSSNVLWCRNSKRRRVGGSSC